MKPFDRTTKKNAATLILFIVCLFIVFPAMLSGCGGGRSSARVSPPGMPDPNMELPEAGEITYVTAPACGSLGVDVKWFSAREGDDYTIDIEYGGESQKRQVQVTGLATGLTVTVDPFPFTIETATMSTMIASRIEPYNGYIEETVTLDEGTDNGEVAYREWVYFSPWTVSAPLPSRLDTYALVSWDGGSCLASGQKQKLSLGYRPCYGLSYFQSECDHVCGDGAIDNQEQCDDGNTVTETCSPGQATCLVCNEKCEKQYVDGTEYCGNSAIDAANNEECDQGAANGTLCTPQNGAPCTYCSSTCKELLNPGPNCGDGAVQTAEGEECDDGNNLNDPCTPTYNKSCRYCDATCHNQFIIYSRCGDGVVDAQNSEECDDGLDNGTLCDAQPGSPCNYCSDTCRTITLPAADCGDGVLQKYQGEECDDGFNNNRACSATYGNACRYCDWKCRYKWIPGSLCGNGVLDIPYEECDDGNNITETCNYGDTSCSVCDASCFIKNGDVSYCGDRFIDSGNNEACDDGNSVTEQCGAAPCPQACNSDCTF